MLGDSTIPLTSQQMSPRYDLSGVRTYAVVWVGCSTLQQSTSTRPGCALEAAGVTAMWMSMLSAVR